MNLTVSDVMKKILPLELILKLPVDKYKKFLRMNIDETIRNYTAKENIIRFKFNNKIYNERYAILITNLILMLPFVENKELEYTGEYLDLNQIKNFNINTLPNYFNLILNNNQDLITENKELIDNLNLSFKHVLNICAEISGKYNIFNGTTLNIYDLLMLYKSNKRFKKLFDQKVPRKLDFTEVAQFINNEFKEMIEILRNEDTCYKPYFQSKTGINEKQFKEIISHVGLKAGLNGIIIPHVIQSNYMQGFSNISDYYINAVLARKSLITSHRRTRQSGYLTRKLSLLLIDNKLSEDTLDCGSTDYINVEIKDDEILHRYNLRYYLDEESNSLKMIHYNTDKYLIGTTLKVRSPITCKSKDNGICKTCYGNLYNVNKDIHIGIEAVLELTEQLTQKLLSAKHLQQVKSDIVEWSEDFLKYFVPSTGMIYTVEMPERNAPNLVIEDYEVDDDNSIKILSMTIEDRGKDVILNEFPVDLIAGDKITNSIQTASQKDMNNIIRYPLKQFDNEVIFTFNLANNELSATLNSIQKLIESNEYNDEITSIDQLINKFLVLLNEGGITLGAVHAELILRELIRDKNDYSLRPTDFSNSDSYKILKVSEAISNSGSPAIILSFERIKAQFENPEFYKKDGQSIFDSLFVE